MELSYVSTTMDGRYRVLLNDEEYLCETGTDPNVNLSVNLAPENPIVQQIQTFCQSDTPTISSLTASNIEIIPFIGMNHWMLLIH